LSSISCRELGDLYERGSGVPRDIVRAAELYARACELGSQFGCREAVRVKDKGGASIEETHRLGAIWVLPPAPPAAPPAPPAAPPAARPRPTSLTPSRPAVSKQAYAEALKAGAEELAKGNELYLRDGQSEALVHYRLAADQGNPEAMRKLGEYYYLALGQVVPKDYVEAMKWFKQAADKGDGGACHWLGWMYFKGYGTLEDRAAAKAWFVRAVDYGNTNSRTNLAEDFKN
jgi:uncharacterized protein